MPNSVLSALRRLMKRQRAQLSHTEQQRCAKQMTARLLRQPRYRAARHIAIYFPVRGEVDSRLLKTQAHRGQHFYLPILHPQRKHHLAFIEWTTRTRFRHNHLRIPEPTPYSLHTRRPERLDVVIVPLLAFDNTGTRLGMGGGFYDRTFAFKQSPTGSQRPWLIGWAYSFQQVEDLTRQAWDIPLDAICTEHEFYHFAARQY